MQLKRHLNMDELYFDIGLLFGYLLLGRTILTTGISEGALFVPAMLMVLVLAILMEIFVPWVYALLYNDIKLELNSGISIIFAVFSFIIALTMEVMIIPYFFGNFFGSYFLSENAPILIIVGVFMVPMVYYHAIKKDDSYQLLREFGSEKPEDERSSLFAPLWFFFGVFSYMTILAYSWNVLSNKLGITQDSMYIYNVLFFIVTTLMPVPLCIFGGKYLAIFVERLFSKYFPLILGLTMSLWYEIMVKVLIMDQGHWDESITVTTLLVAAFIIPVRFILLFHKPVRIINLILGGLLLVMYIARLFTASRWFLKTVF